MRSEDDVKMDVRELWVAVFGELPSLEMEPSAMIGFLVEHLPQADYTRLNRPLEPSAD